MRYQNYMHLPFTAFDAETNILNVGEDKIGRNKASPYHPDNGIVWWGVTSPAVPDRQLSMSYLPNDWGDNEFKMNNIGSQDFFTALQGAKVLVGHNIKFDLLHAMQYYTVYSKLMDWLRDGGVIWDTMVVEYLLTGQESQFISLDKLSTKYGGHVKDDRLKEVYWDKGIDTVNIPRVILLPYLQGDLRNTANNYMAQLGRIESLTGKQQGNFYALIGVQMEALLATTMIEYNGIHFDVPAAADGAANLALQKEQKEEELSKVMARWFQLNNSPDNPEILPEDCSAGSVMQLSAMLVEGTFKYRRQMPVRDSNGERAKYKGGIKKGQYKMRYEDLILNIDGMLKNVNHGLSKTEKGYGLDETALKKLLELTYVNDNPSIKDFIVRLLLYRSIAKEYSTSYMGLLELTWPTDSCIHGNMNHCSTHTGRLSSSAPNQQNFSSKEVKE